MSESTTKSSYKWQASVLGSLILGGLLLYLDMGYIIKLPILKTMIIVGAVSHLSFSLATWIYDKVLAYKNKNAEAKP